MIGTTLSHYHVLERIGAGGMGVVYRARDQRLERDVALKVLPQGTLASENHRRRFRREALAISRLTHPGIATIHDFDTQDGTDFLVMEYLPGETLDVRIARGPLPESEAIDLASQVSEALEASHEMGVIHLDLKPGNIHVSERGHVKVFDFGLARILQREGGWVRCARDSGGRGPWRRSPMLRRRQSGWRPRWRRWRRASSRSPCCRCATCRAIPQRSTSPTASPKH